MVEIPDPDEKIAGSKIRAKSATFRMHKVDQHEIAAQSYTVSSGITRLPTTRQLQDVQQVLPSFKRPTKSASRKINPVQVQPSDSEVIDYTQAKILHPFPRRKRTVRKSQKEAINTPAPKSQQDRDVFSTVRRSQDITDLDKKRSFVVASHELSEAKKVIGDHVQSGLV
jgi:hypothetical protein